MEMQSIIDEAKQYSEYEEQLKLSQMVLDDDFNFDGVGQARIVIVGCGGAGNNTINRLQTMGIDGAQTIAINTDKQHLDHTNADKKILIGKSLTRGLGAGGDPELGGKSAEMARKTLVSVLDGADMVFVTAGMGGGTGTGSAPVVANIAKELGAIVMGIVSTPFHVERARNIKAQEGIENLKNACDTVIVLDNDRLLSYVPGLPIGQAFSVMDQLIANTAKGISETITQSSLINLDYADVKTIMTRGGVAVMLLAESNASNKADDVVRKAMSNPLFDVDYRGATGALVHITGGSDMSLREAEEVASALTYDLDPNADVIWGARVEDNFEGKIKVMAIMTGVQSPQIVGMGMNYQRSRQMVGNTAENMMIGKKRLLDIIA